MFKTIEKDLEGIIIEKKSKFIANLFYIENEEEAQQKINEIKKKYFDERHHCFAYRVLKDGKVISKQSDDGEPSGTAGAPMLNILEKQQLTNVLVIVTRYFGGILLGTGGLVKAYSDALKEAINNVRIEEIEDGYEIEVSLEYEDISNFEYFCSQNNIKIIKKEYTDKIKIIAEISKESYEKKVEKNLNNNYPKIQPTIIKERIIKISGKTC